MQTGSYMVVVESGGGGGVAFSLLMRTPHPLCSMWSPFPVMFKILIKWKKLLLLTGLQL